ncbi:alpha/beta hydrolase [Methyloligella sp. 2.7D]|uniref:alpha/beta fold hydrolase n=1 Tax=unclassified Methyloligella TaxID=2625955 RepID=UPI00157DF689|nr:alpha/beta hydrolase [Methyloligella sp. GL2]QKP77076.1 alpha/beta hydrolase [Methyloligella sp. GL2]
MDSKAPPEPKSLNTLTLPDGRKIAYAEFGDPGGAPVFAFHGTPGSRLTFEITEGSARARNLRIIAPDRPGYGRSDFKAFTQLGDWVADLEALADGLGLNRFALIGVSGGGPYAVAAASALSHRVEFLALVSPVGPVADLGARITLSPMHRRIFRELPNRPRLAAAVFWAMRRLLSLAPALAYRGLVQRAGAADRAVLLKQAVKQSLLDGHEEGLSAGVHGAVQDLRLFSGPWGIDFDQVIVPAVLWQGLADRNVPPAASRALAEMLPNCRLDLLPEAGHYWVFDHLDAVLDAVEASLKAGRGLA